MKEGLLVKFTDTVMTYTGSAPSPVQKYTGKNNKVFKSYNGKVEVSNKLVTVIMHEDGRVEIKPHTQLMGSDVQ